MKKGVIRNLIYSSKVIYSKDKVLFFIRFLKVIMFTILKFVSPLALSYSVKAIEEHLEFKEAIILPLIFVLITLVVAIIHGITYPIEEYHSKVFRQKLLVEINLRSLYSDYELFEHPESQDLFTRALESVNVIDSNFDVLMEMIGSLVTFIAAVIVVSFVNAWLIIGLVILAIIKGLLGTVLKKKNKEYYDQLIPISRKLGYVNSISKNMTIAKDKKIYEMQKFINNEQHDCVDKYLAIYKKQLIFSGIINALVELLVLIELYGLYFFIGIEVLVGAITIASFTYLLQTIFNVSQAIANIINKYNSAYGNSLIINDYIAFNSLDLYKDDESRIEVDFSKCENVKIEFKHVYYSYYLQKGYTLKDLNFTIEAGERIALVGENGAGKTTLVKLLCGFYHPTKGEILINGINIETIKRKSLFKYIAPVFQDNSAYNLTINENIALGDKDYSLNRINEAINTLELNEAIDKFEDKGESIVNRDIFPNGIDLSGGEKQKMEIARAMYKDAPLIVLDEPTSNLDAFSEKHIYDNLDKIIKNHSSIFISHRLSSSKFCDKIIVLEKGSVIEEGTHKELMALEGTYAHLFNLQAELYKGEAK